MRKRLPKLQDILPVYAVIAVMFAGWTITSFLWKLSAWLLLLNLGEIFTIFSYAIAVNFLESLTILLMLLIASAMLPAHIFRDDFVVRGTILSIGLVGSLMGFVGSEMRFGMESRLRLWILPLVVLLLTVILLGRLPKLPSVRSTAIWLSDRMVVFLFLLVPLFTFLFLYVIVRNIA